MVSSPRMARLTSPLVLDSVTNAEMSCRCSYRYDKTLVVGSFACTIVISIIYLPYFLHFLLRPAEGNPALLACYQALGLSYYIQAWAGGRGVSAAICSIYICRTAERTVLTGQLYCRCIARDVQPGCAGIRLMLQIGCVAGQCGTHIGTGEGCCMLLGIYHVGMVLRGDNMVAVLARSRLPVKSATGVAFGAFSMWNTSVMEADVRIMPQPAGMA